MTHRIRIFAGTAVLALLTGPATAADTAPVVSTAGSLLQVFIGLVAVLLLIAGVAWMAKRLGVAHGGSSSLLRVVSTASVGTRERVVMVEVGETWLVVGVAQGSVNALLTLPKGELPARPSTTLPGSFGARLQQMIEQRRGR